MSDKLITKSQMRMILETLLDLLSKGIKVLDDIITDPVGVYSLMHFDDPDDPWKDECGNTWTPKGNVTISSFDGAFGNCLYVSGKANNGLYGESPITVGKRDFTIDFIAKITDSSSAWGSLFCLNPKLGENLMETYRPGDIAMGRYNRTKNLSINLNDMSGKSMICASGYDYTFTNVNLFETHHYALVYQHKQSLAHMFIDGNLIKTFENIVIDRTPRYARIIHNCHSSTNYLNGYVDEFRIIDGLAVWTENFTPPTEPYTTES